MGDTIYPPGTGTTFATGQREQLSILRYEEVTGPKLRGEFGFHVKVYERNPEITAIIHVHSPMPPSRARTGGNRTSRTRPSPLKFL